MFLVACSNSTPHSATTPAPYAGPPWHQFSTDVEKERYESGGPNCGWATLKVTEMASMWKSVGYGSTKQELTPGLFMETLSSPVGVTGVIQYREKADGAKVIELAMNVNTSTMFIDYYVFRALDTGAVSLEDDAAFNLATGEYFCVYSDNN